MLYVKDIGSTEYAFPEESLVISAGPNIKYKKHTIYHMARGLVHIFSYGQKTK